MKIDSTEKKYSSKLHRFFDLTYKLLVINMLTIILSLGIVTIFPAFVTAHATIKYDLDDTSIFKSYFHNFKQYFLKSFLMGLALLVVVGIGIYAYIFWMGLYQGNQVLAQVGIVVISISLIIFSLMIAHLPLLLITFTKLSNWQIFKTSLYVCLRYFITTMILLIANILIIILPILCLFRIVDWGAITIWMLFGISLPLFLAIKVTTPVYYRFAKIDMNKIKEEVEEDLEDE